MISGIGHIKEWLNQQHNERRITCGTNPDKSLDEEPAGHASKMALAETNIGSDCAKSDQTVVANGAGPSTEQATCKQSGAKVLMEKPKHMSDRLWQKYKQLHNRREDILKKSEEKRNRDKHKDDTKTGTNQLQSTKESQRTVPHTVSKELKRKHCQSTEAEQDTRSSKKEHWKNIKQYFHINDHLTGGDKSTVQKSKTEDQLEQALRSGNVESAEELSDYLATREFGTKIADAIKARDFMQHKKEQDEKQASKRKRTLPWGFGHKERWETKGNM